MKSLLAGLKDHWEKILVIVVMLSVAGVSWALIGGIGGIVGFHLDSPTGARAIQTRPAEEYDGEVFESAIGALETPMQMDIDPGHRGFISDEYVTCVNGGCQRPIPYEALTCPFCGSPQPPVRLSDGDRDRDGIPDSEEVQLGLDPYNPLDASGDNDGDGFSNLEEYRFKTDVSNPEDRPPEAAKLRWYNLRRIPFILRFKGVQELPASTQYQINIGTVNRTTFAKLGQPVQGYIVENYEERITTTENGEQIDESILTVRSVSDESEVYNLVKGRIVQKEEFTTDLLLFKPPFRTPYRNLKIGKEITVGSDKYQIVDITPRSVTIRDLQSGQEFDVPQFQQGVPNAAAAGGRSR